MNNTLREIRENALRMSKEDLSRKLNISLEEYEKLETDSSMKNFVDMPLLVQLMQATGLSFEDLAQNTKTQAEFKIEDNWNSIASYRKSILRYLEEGINKIPSDENFNRKINSIKEIVLKSTRKPRIALVGRSDVGKSTLINSLLNYKVLPQEWTPTTSIAIFVKHLDDKPTNCEENVLIFKSDGNKIWDDTKIEDLDYTKSLCIAKGDYSLLYEYGARQGKHYNQTSASSAVIFLDSPILKNCDILDLPGYGTKDRDEDDSILAQIKEIDILIYLSVANGFMRAEDINWLQQEITHLAPITLNNQKLKPLSNLYIVASQAQVVSHGSHSELKMILEKAADRFESTVSKDYWRNICQNANFQDFRKRFFTFSTDQISLREDFENDLKNLLEILPVEILTEVKNITYDKLKELEKEIKVSNSTKEKIINDRAQQKEKFQKISEEAPEKLNEIENQKIEIVKLIKNVYSRESANNFTKAYNRILTKDNIIKLINENNWRNKEEDKKNLCSKISNLLNEEYAEQLRRPSEELADKINNILDNFERYTISSNFNELQVDGGFDVKSAFAGGLAGIATYGALSVWAASLGNLGAYILVAKGVSLLAAMGISVGGTAAAMSAISLIGGPIVIAVALAALIGLVVKWIFGKSWKDSIAEKIIKEYDKQNGLVKFQNKLNQYWDDSCSAFISAMDSLREQYLEYLHSLEKATLADDQELLKSLEENKIKLKFIQKLINNFHKNDGDYSF